MSLCLSYDVLSRHNACSSGLTAFYAVANGRETLDVSDIVYAIRNSTEARRAWESYSGWLYENMPDFARNVARMLDRYDRRDYITDDTYRMPRERSKRIDRERAKLDSAIAKLDAEISELMEARTALQRARDVM